MKRLIDLIGAALGLLLMSPVLLPVMYLVWRQDKHSPFYNGPRVGLNGAMFSMLKLRSMVVNADKSGVDSTSAADKRITPIGHFVRRYKLDEFSQLWNVLRGDMSLVGPRPNVAREVALYTDEERILLSVKPGVTDFASIVFADEGEILKDKEDPDLAYNQLIRPWKSRLGLFYVKNRGFFVDIFLIALTALAIVSRNVALLWTERLLKHLGAEPRLCEIARRIQPLQPFAPPGAAEIVKTRQAEPHTKTIA